MRYTHIGIDDQANALKSLPAPKTNGEEGRALQMRCNPGVSDCHNVAEDATKDDPDKPKKSRKPLQAKTYGTDRRNLSQIAKAEGTGLEPAAPYGVPQFQ